MNDIKNQTIKQKVAFGLVMFLAFIFMSLSNTYLQQNLSSNIEAYAGFSPLMSLFAGVYLAGFFVLNTFIFMGLMISVLLISMRYVFKVFGVFWITGAAFKKEITGEKMSNIACRFLYFEFGKIGMSILIIPFVLLGLGFGLNI